jgi:hypothetical protein
VKFVRGALVFGALLITAPGFAAAQSGNQIFPQSVTSAPTASTPFGAGDAYPVIEQGLLKQVPGNQLAGLNTATTCASGASPALCGAAPAGSVAIPAGATQTLVIDSTAITANSTILLTVDAGATIAGITCNATISTLTQPVVTARSVATSFTIEEPATTSTHPVCVDYLVIN